jgi:competence protein ComEC
MKAILVLVFTMSLGQRITQEGIVNFIIWNVGQGSWSTFVDQEYCLHFDMGGELSPQPKVLHLCKNRSNQFYLSHEDRDHMNFVSQFSQRVQNFCIYYPNEIKKKSLKKITPCQEPHPYVELIFKGLPSGDANDQSAVYLLLGQVLIPGDAPMSAERLFQRQVPHNLYLLILGHHGSKTSSSAQLLRQAQPSMSVSSARKKRYGHPHWKVTARLKRHQIPLLRTESLGHIGFKLSPAKN